METRKDKAGSVPVIANRRSSPRNGDEKLRNRAQILQARLASEKGGLTIADETDFGGDPYNSTGQHVIIKAKQLHSK